MRDAYVTLSSIGQLIKAKWPRPGLKLNYGVYA
jgi:gluconolactonase